LGLVFRLTGLDAKLPGLKLLYDPAAAVEAAAEATGNATCGLSATTTLRAHRLGKRAVLQLDLDGGRKVRLFARLRPTSSTSGVSAYTRHQEIATALAGAPAIAVPQPLHHDADLGAAFFSALPGHAPTFKGAVGTSAAKVVARALATIVALGPEAGAPYTVADELAMLGEWSDRVCSVFPGLAGAAGQALTVVEEALFRIEAVEPRPCHRDFHAGQILIHEGRAGVLDFDTYRLADPALDIGNLIAHLRMSGLRENRRLGFIEETFRRSMRSYARPMNVKAWTGAALLRLGCIYAFTSQGPRLARALFREAAR
jgi:aminoglycoside phosphotransferase (APT) family kinase protein